MSSEKSQSTALRQIAQDAPDYKGYKPLDSARRQIRILDLGPNLACTLRYVSLDEKPVYHALSYCWGPPGITETMTIQDLDDTGRAPETVQVRKTIGKFLKSLYKRHGHIAVWLDVICINQRSFSEQSAQVALMGDIYRGAEGVYAWTGPWDPDIEYGFDYAQASSQQLSLDDFDLGKVRFGLETLFARPYWTRVWIVQECVLTDRLFVLCGPLQISWEALEDAVETCFPRNRPLVLQRYEPIRDARFRIDPYSGKALVFDTTLAEHASRFQERQCADPRDKIYGFRAIADVAGEVPVDYSCTLFDLLISVVSVQNRVQFERWARICEPGQPTAQPLRQWWSAYNSSSEVDVDMIECGNELIKIMSLETNDIMEGLHDHADDYLLMPLVEEPVYDYYRDEPGVSGQVGSHAVTVDENGVVCSVILDIHREVSPLAIVQRLDASSWQDHIWACTVAKAVHLSRCLYVFFMLFHQWMQCEDYPDGDSLAMDMLDRRQIWRLSDSVPRRCNCDPNVKVPVPAPWRVLAH